MAPDVEGEGMNPTSNNTPLSERDDDTQEFLAHAASMALHALGKDAASSALASATPDNAYADIRHILPIWNGRRRTDASHRDVVENHRYNFSRQIGETWWVFELTGCMIIFLDLQVGDHRSSVAAEVLLSSTGQSLESKSMHLLSSLDRINALVKEFAGTHLRVLDIVGSGRRGLLLPKTRRWGVLPLPEIAFGAAATAPTSQRPFGELSLADFVEYQQCGARFDPQ